jgi:hypothetical protein
MDAFGIVRRSNRAFDKREVVRTFYHATGGFKEVGNLHFVGDSQQLILAIEQAELAPVTGCEFPDCELRFAFRFHSSLISSHDFTRS